MIRYLLFPVALLWFLLITVLGWLASFLPTGSKRWFHLSVYHYWSKAFLNLFYFEEITHRENKKPLPKQYILISNHYSGVDTIWLPAKFKAVPLAKSDLSKWPVIGSILKAAGMIFVSRHESRSRAKSVDLVLKTLNKGNNVLIFPEGGCHGRYLVPFKDGAFTISKLSGIPIVPAYVYYEDEDTYELKNNEGSDYLLQCLFKRKSRNIHLHLFDAFYPADYETAEEYKADVFKLYQKTQVRYK